MEFRILGLLAVGCADGSIEVGAPKLRTLLAALLVRSPDAMSPAAIAEVLWGDGRLGAEGTVYVYISRLRQRLGGDVVTRNGSGYRLAIDPDRIDANRFERLALAASARRASLTPGEASRGLAETLALWRGPALQEFRGLPWADAAAARLDELRLVTLERRIEADLSCGLAPLLVPELEGLVAEQPFREQLCAQYIVSLYRCNRQADALTAYARLRDRLADELGILPSPPLQRLERAVLLQSPELDQNGDPSGHAVWSPPESNGAGDPPPLGTFLAVTVQCGDARARRRALAAAQRGVERFGGTVVSLGDSELVVAFGSTGAAQDHAVRAAAAARSLAGTLDSQQLVTRYVIHTGAPGRCHTVDARGRLRPSRRLVPGDVRRRPPARG